MTKYSITELRFMLDKRLISAPELAKIILDRIAESDSKLNSYITVCEKEALADAERAQKMIDSGNARMLTGIPISVKDNICTKDIRTTCGSKMLSDFVPFYDAAAVERLKNEGCVIPGKTNMDEFAMGSSSQTSYFGGVKNPLDPTRSPGGSSGGAAAAVAAGLCIAALGTDTGGSVRQPAAFCGAVGLCPTYGTVSRYGLIAFASSLDRIGIIASWARDCAFMLDAISGRDERDATSSDTNGGYAAKCGSSMRGIRIGLPKEFLDASDTEVSRAVIRAANFYRGCGCEIVECPLPSLKYAVSAYYLISSAEAAANLARFDGMKYGHRSDKGNDHAENTAKSRAEGFGREVKRRIMLGNYALSAGYYDEYYMNALRVRNKIKEEYAKIFESCDVILAPTAPTAAPVLGEIENDPVKMYASDICTVPSSIAGLPSISAVCGYDRDGMPIGMSLTGRAFDEATIIALCEKTEGVLS